MNTFQTLPWWALSYLGVVFALSFAGAFSGFRTDPAAAVSGLFSSASVFVFVIGIFHPPLAAYFGWFLVPMVVIGIMWEFNRAVFETNSAEKELRDEIDLTDEERVFLINFAVALNALIIVPGYMCGVKLCFDLLAGLF